MQALVHAATLAASSHNTQPWSFRIYADAITISPDFSRRCPVVDPDDSHLFKSLGCAAENLAAAAPAYGLMPDIRIESDGRVVVGLTNTTVQAGAISLTALPNASAPNPLMTATRSLRATAARSRLRAWARASVCCSSTA